MPSDYNATQHIENQKGPVVRQLLCQIKAKNTILKIVRKSQDGRNSNIKEDHQTRIKQPGPSEPALSQLIPQATQHNTHTAGRLCAYLAYIWTLYFAIGMGRVRLASPPYYFDIMREGRPMLFKFLTVAPVARTLAKGLMEALSKLSFSRPDSEAYQWTEDNLLVFEGIIAPILWKFCPTGLTFLVSLIMLII